MKKTFLVLLCLSICLLAVLPASAITIYAKDSRRATAANPEDDFVPVHDYFAKGKPVVGKIPNDEIIEVLPGFSPDGKYNQVVYADGTKAGWVLGKHIRIIKD